MGLLPRQHQRRRARPEEPAIDRQRLPAGGDRGGDVVDGEAADRTGERAAVGIAREERERVGGHRSLAGGSLAAHVLSHVIAFVLAAIGARLAGDRLGGRRVIRGQLLRKLRPLFRRQLGQRGSCARDGKLLPIPE